MMVSVAEKWSRSLIGEVLKTGKMLPNQRATPNKSRPGEGILDGLGIKQVDGRYEYS
jgi:hypothetical protein